MFINNIYIHYVKKYLYKLTQIYKYIYFKERDHMSVVAWQVQNLIGEAGRLETQEKKGLQFGSKSSLLTGQKEPLLFSIVLMLENRFLLSGGQHFFFSGLHLIG